MQSMAPETTKDEEGGHAGIHQSDEKISTAISLRSARIRQSSTTAAMMDKGAQVGRLLMVANSMIKGGQRPSGHAILEGLAADASIGIADILPADKVAEMTKLVRADRRLLEQLAARGQMIAAYRAAKAKYGIKS
jgi:hypothetical protein